MDDQPRDEHAVIAIQQQNNHTKNVEDAVDPSLADPANIQPVRSGSSLARVYVCSKRLSINPKRVHCSVYITIDRRKMNTIRDMTGRIEQWD